MKVTIAKTAGFCMGVRRAVEMAFDAANSSPAPICTYGPLIHNPQMLSILKEKGISVINEIPQTGNGIVIIRAHGIPPQERQALINAGYEVIDATCPRVIKVQSIISRHARQGYASIIVGDREHPEVIGLLGYAGEKGYVIDSLESLKELPEFEKAIIVSQTTQSSDFFENVRNLVATCHPSYKIFNTICDSTEKRQLEVKTLAAGVDAVIVVGGYNSGNTQRLVETASEGGKIALHIETAEDVDIRALAGVDRIGITAGASTPNWIIKEVYQDLEAQMAASKSPVFRYAYSLMRFLVNSNIYLAIGAACLTFAGIWLQGLPPGIAPISAAAFYILCMHTVNQMLERQSDRYNDPYRAGFYQKNRMALTLFALFAGAGAFMASWFMGPLFFLMVVCMSLLGLLYNIDTIAKKKLMVRRGLKSIPGSKTVLTALAWGIITSLLPALYLRGHINMATVVVFPWICAMVLVRTAYFDIMDMQGSRIMGKETIPILLGIKKTFRLLRGMLVAMMMLLPIGVALGILPLAGLMLIVCPVLMYFFLRGYEQKMTFSAMHRGFVIESFFILAGILSMFGFLVSP